MDFSEQVQLVKGKWGVKNTPARQTADALREFRGVERQQKRDRNQDDAGGLCIVNVMGFP